MRKDLVAVFCASLLIFMLLPMPTTVDSDLDDVEILDSSGSTASVDSLAWELAQKAGGSSGDDRSNSIAVSANGDVCLLYTSPSPRDGLLSRMPSSA